VSGYHLVGSNPNNVWVIGNGESRKNLDLKSLKGTIIGCNAIHRDHVCDAVIAVDRRMVHEILKNPEYNQTPIFTRSDWMGQFKSFKNVHVLPDLPYSGSQRWDDPWHWNSGPFAVLIACLQNPAVINLVGFDLYGCDDKVNNLYKNTDNYDPETRNAIDNRHWLHQLKKLFDCFLGIEFIQWQKTDWRMPSDWSQSKNLTFKVLNV
jgi:hypothetical protein